MMFVLGLLLLALVALALTSWPLVRSGRRVESALAGIFVIGLGIGVYLLIGRPDLALSPPSSQPAQMQPQDIEAAIAELAQRLEANPDDPQGWTMLGRSYLVTGQYEKAAQAFLEAQARLPGEDPDLLASFAEARTLANPAGLEGEIGALFDRVLELEAGNPRGLWYGGLAAQARGDLDTARIRWQTLLEHDLPDEFRQVVEARLAAIDGARSGEILQAEISVARELEDVLPDDGVLYLFLRTADDAGHGPPLAARRVDRAELPLTLSLRERDLLRGGALPEGEFRVVARIGSDAEPQAGRGDLEGQARWNPAEGRSVQIVLDMRHGE